MAPGRIRCCRLNPTTNACAGKTTSTAVPSMSQRLLNGQIKGHMTPEKMPASAAVTSVGAKRIA